MPDDASAPGTVRVGAAFASRRQELGITQRELARKGFITASSLIAFEKGRSWPRERTRAMLEELAQWPAGTLAGIRAGLSGVDAAAVYQNMYTQTQVGATQSSISGGSGSAGMPRS